MNPVDHPHGGGNHQHIGKASTISREAARGQKAGYVSPCITCIILLANWYIVSLLPVVLVSSVVPKRPRIRESKHFSFLGLFFTFRGSLGIYGLFFVVLCKIKKRLLPKTFSSPTTHHLHQHLSSISHHHSNRQFFLSFLCKGLIRLYGYGVLSTHHMLLYFCSRVAKKIFIPVKRFFGSFFSFFCARREKELKGSFFSLDQNLASFLSGDSKPVCACVVSACVYVSVVCLA
jgi:hypothetical protein